MSVAPFHCRKSIFLIALLLFLLHPDLGKAGNSGLSPAGSSQNRKKEKQEAAVIYRKAYRIYQNARRQGTDPSEAIRIFRQCAAMGLPAAELQLGLCFFFGDHVVQNKDSAAYWFSRAALQGEAQAQCNLAQCYFYGEGVKKDLNQAFRWYLLAAR